MLKVGLIGCGGMGKTHAGCYDELKEYVEFAAVADLDYEKAKDVADRLGGEIYTSGEELLANADVDIIDICLPTCLHTKFAVAAMEKGCHVFLEKPVCLNMEEAELLLKTQEKTGKKVQIGQVIRFWDEYVWLKNAVDNGTYGKVISGVFSRLSANPKWGWENWYNNPELSGSMALDLHIHDADYVRYLMGEPDKIDSRATRSADGVIQQIFTTYRYGDAVINAEGCWDYPDEFPFQMTFRVKMEKATAVYDGSVLTVYPVEGGKFTPEIQVKFAQNEDIGINVSNQGGYYNELKYFIKCVEKNQPVKIAPLSEAIKSTALVFEEIKLAGGVKK